MIDKYWTWHGMKNRTVAVFDEQKPLDAIPHLKVALAAPETNETRAV